MGRLDKLYEATEETPDPLQPGIDPEALKGAYEADNNRPFTAGEQAEIARQIRNQVCEGLCDGVLETKSAGPEDRVYGLLFGHADTEDTREAGSGRRSGGAGVRAGRVHSWPWRPASDGPLSSGNGI